MICNHSFQKLSKLSKSFQISNRTFDDGAKNIQLKFSFLAVYVPALAETSTEFHKKYIQDYLQRETIISVAFPQAKRNCSRRIIFVCTISYSYILFFSKAPFHSFHFTYMGALPLLATHASFHSWCSEMSQVLA